MGALGPVFVEQLTAKNTIEEVMNEMNEARPTNPPTLDTISDPKERHAKLHKLLKSAKLIRPPQEPKVKKRKAMGAATVASGTITEDQHTNSMNSKQSTNAGRVRFKD
jgi:hypothetical protein